MHARPRHVLVFEPDARGHAEEWLGHIVRAAQAAPTHVRVTLAIPDVLIAPLKELVPLSDKDKVAFLPLDPASCAPCLGRPLARAAFARWRLMRACLDSSRADEGHFLCLDTLSLPLALGLGMQGRSVGGILFRPSVHYHALHPWRPTVSERLRDDRKGILYPRMLRNRALSRVLTLDPYFATWAYQQYRNGDKVVALADPAAALPEARTADPARFDPGRMRFLLFGELTARKGVLPLLDACALLDRDAASRVAILIAGRIAPDIAPQVHRRLEALRTARPELQIELADRRLPADALADAVASSDVVLAPYQRFVGSSGVLIWAARFGRPVITQDYGMIGRLVADYGLGLAVDTTQPHSLAEALAAAVGGTLREQFDPERARAFGAGRDGGTFAAQVLGLGDATVTTSRHERSPSRLAGTTT